jgi:hypothetical protein
MIDSIAVMRICFANQSSRGNIKENVSQLGFDLAFKTKTVADVTTIIRIRNTQDALDRVRHWTEYTTAEATQPAIITACTLP